MFKEKIMRIDTEKKELLIRLLEDTKGIMDDFLKEALEKKLDYNEPKNQKLLYLLAILLHDIMVVAKKLRETYDNNFQEGLMGMRLHFHLEKIEELWPESSKKNMENEEGLF